ncbi:type II toxin-antitoxin system VapC family toxin [Pedobacter soli]|uniref:PIN domain nuclease, a component of toxin-antitoxin system (PIN domain) n=1 Tax=Pedobacter soli TaxID=390242 RepID=A0A1G6SLL0_9SPHI|nr:type II toxin-antitoxin system VapC family toxin [Pedobacter soli]SDD17800.1 PIN domain nuclease, a component of toxin-antitoxin system (PIN domain) [Pedobacter soli]
MNILLDTHIVIWFITNDTKLPKRLKRIIEDPNNKCFVSIATYWELSIKYSLGRLNLNSSIEEIFNIIEVSGFDILPITLNHILQLTTLEHHHNDPFDRLIIAQSISENLSVISIDNYFPAYKIQLIK